MAVVLKNQVVDHLRASRAADDVIDRLKENSWETHRKSLTKLVESANWKFGPAELLATFDHHLVCKAPSGDILHVEWTREGGGYSLGRATIHESATPVSDLGFEVMETAKAAVDRILDEDYVGAGPMIASVAEALDAGGDLQRQITNEVLVRSLTRDAWWHSAVGLREGIESELPTPRIEEGDLQGSVTDLLAFLKQKAAALSTAARQLSISEASIEVETLTRDVVEDVERAISALVNLDRRRTDEVGKVYEAVMAVTPQLLNGIAFLQELTENTDDVTG